MRARARARSEPCKNACMRRTILRLVNDDIAMIVRLSAHLVKVDQLESLLLPQPLPRAFACVLVEQVERGLAQLLEVIGAHAARKQGRPRQYDTPRRSARGGRPEPLERTGDR